MNNTRQVTSERTRPASGETAGGGGFVLSPSSQRLSAGAVALGLVLRVFIAGCAVFGLTLFICDAFRIDLSTGKLLLLCGAVTAAAALLVFSVRTFIATVCAMAVAGAAVYLAAGEPILYHAAFAANSVGALYNTIMARLANAGYRTLLPYRMSQLVEAPPEVLTAAGVAILALFFALIFVSCIIRRVRMLPMLTVGTAVCTTIFTYNISGTNWGFAVIVVTLCAIIVVKMYDNLYNNRRKSKQGRNIKDGGDTGTVAASGGTRRKAGATKTPSKRRRTALRAAAPGGFAGGTALAVAGAIILLPAAGIHSNWREIKAVGDKMDMARAIVSSIIIGDMPSLSQLGYLGNMDTLGGRTARTSDRAFTGKTVMRVKAPYNTPVYLRSWVGTSYHEDSWYSPSAADSNLYFEILFAEEFTPESLTYNFLSAVNPRLVSGGLTSYSDNTALGYITMPIDVDITSSSGNLLFIPSIMNSDLSLLEYGSREGKPYGGVFNTYAEGITTTSWFNFNKEYRTVSFVPIYRREGFADNIHNAAIYYDYMMHYIRMYPDLTDASEIDDMVSFVESSFEQLEIDYNAPSLIRRYYEMDEAARSAFIYSNTTLRAKYTQFVRDNYLLYPEYSADSAFNEAYTEIIKHLQSQPENSGFFPMLPTAEQYDDVPNYQQYAASRFEMADSRYTHQIVLAVIDYLADNCVYTLTPAPPTKTNDPLDAFLGEVREGYCVQFATAATMLLRAFGIPARYVEGYVASEFVRGDSGLVATVRDYNAHAWVEVYNDYFGWMTYETTPPYYSAMYEPFPDSSYRPPAAVGGYEEEPEYIFDPLPSSGDKKDSPWFDFGVGSLAAAGVILLVCGGALYIFISKRSKLRWALVRRRNAIAKAKRSSLDGEGARQLARELGVYIMRLHQAAGLVPEQGELPSEYALRVDNAEIAAFHKFTDVMPRIEKAEFGLVSDRHDLGVLADYLSEFWEALPKTLTRRRRFWLSVVKRVI